MRSALALSLALTLAAVASRAHASAPDEGPLVRLGGPDATVRVEGLLQLELVPFVGDDAFVADGDPAEAPGFRLRRARLGLAGTAWTDTDFELSLQATPEGLDLLDAWVGWRPLANLAAYAGARKIPFSRFALNASSDSALADRPLAVRAMAPFRQVGLTLEGDLVGGRLRWAAGAYNGLVRGATFHEGYGESTALAGNRFTNLAYAARVDLAPLGATRPGLADPAHGPLRAGLGGALFYDPGKTIETLGFEVDLLLQAAGFHLAAELLMDSAEPATQPTTGATLPAALSRLAAVVELGWVALPERLGFTVRAELLDDDTERDNAGDALVLTGGAQLYLHGARLKASLEFTHREELDGPSLANDALLAQLQLAL